MSAQTDASLRAPGLQSALGQQRINFPPSPGGRLADVLDHVPDHPGHPCRLHRVFDFPLLRPHYTRPLALTSALFPGGITIKNATIAVTGEGPYPGAESLVRRPAEALS